MTSITTSTLSRRRALQIGGAALTASWFGDTIWSLADAMTTADLAGSDVDLHLLRRTSFGPTVDELERLRSIGAEAYLDEQLSLTDAAVESEVAAMYPLTTQSAHQIYVTSVAPGSPVRQYHLQLQKAMLHRATHSRAQLFEVMVEFWNDHFNTYLRKNRIPLKVAFDRDVIRANALGNFGDMLRATVRHGEMLRYLDNWVNTAGAVNENYARELLELHTLGKDGGYSEADLKALARILTGLTYHHGEPFPRNPETVVAYGEPHFVAENHDQDAKHFLGRDFPAGGGEEEIDRAIDILASHPSTARYVASELCTRFVSEDPPSDLVGAVAADFNRTSGDIASMLRVIFESEAFRTSKGSRRRRPIHVMVGAVRAVGVELSDDVLNTRVFGTPTNGGELLRSLANAGQEPFGWIPPNGYPDDDAYWDNTNSLLHEMRFLVALAESRSFSSLLSDPVSWPRRQSVADSIGRGDTPRAVTERAIEQLVLDAVLSPEAVEAAVAFVANGADPDVVAPPNALSARLPGLVFVLLSSPWSQVR